MLRLGEWAGYVCLGVVSDREVRCDDLKMVRSLGRGIKSDLDGEVEVVLEGSGSMTQLRDIFAMMRDGRSAEGLGTLRGLYSRILGLLGFLRLDLYMMCLAEVGFSVVGCEILVSVSAGEHECGGSWLCCLM